MIIPIPAGILKGSTQYQTEGGIWDTMLGIFCMKSGGGMESITAIKASRSNSNVFLGMNKSMSINVCHIKLSSQYDNDAKDRVKSQHNKT